MKIDLLERLTTYDLAEFADSIKIDKVVLTDGRPTVFVRCGDKSAMARSSDITDCIKSIFVATNPDIRLMFDDEKSYPAATTQRPPADAKPVQAPKRRLIYGEAAKKIKAQTIQSLSEATGKARIEGRIVKIDVKETFDKRKCIITFNVTDYSSTISCKFILEKRAAAGVIDKLKKGMPVAVEGSPIFDKYANDVVIEVKFAESIALPEREDKAPQKRVELHMHTKMSALDGFTPLDAIVKRAAQWGHEAIAVTDHGVVQAFPDMFAEAKKTGIKHIFGMEGYLLDDSVQFDITGKQYVVFDLETTGLDSRYDHITEIGAIKLRDGVEIERFSSLCNPGVLIPENVIAISGITNEMVAAAPPESQVVRSFFDFLSDAEFVVAHNAKFDTGFIITQGNRVSRQFFLPYIDTLMLSRYLLRNLKSHKLNLVAEFLNIDLTQHHRAVHDAQATSRIFSELAARTGVMLPAVYPGQHDGTAKYHIVLLAKNQIGLRNLYKLVSYSNLNHFKKDPLIPKSLLAMHRDGLLLGSACEAGEVFQAILKGKDDSLIRNIADMYDYLEIQPLGNNEFLIRDMIVGSRDDLIALNKRIVALGDELGKPVVATCDVHFLDPQDECFRRIITSIKFSDADWQAPLYFRTTHEMLEEFSYLGEEKAYEVVVTNTCAIARQCEPLKPFPDGTFQPKIDGAQQELSDLTYKNAHRIYGDPLPEPVKERLEHELNSIIKHEFSALYMTAQKLVQKSMSDGYLVGSRGSVGSSFVAFLAGITEVNALPPHYVCPDCKHADFDVDHSQYHCGCDMPDKDCEVCGAKMIKDGFEIPFEVFLGFDGDKVPDIDLNFSGEYQPTAHKYTEELFGEDNVFRAGTISKIQDRVAYGYIMKYFDAKGVSVPRAEVDRLIEGCVDVKQTTGQHPGGIIVLPQDHEIYEFTPIQHPGDNASKNVVTTHFDFHSLHDRLVKLDILGHDVPTIIRMLQDLTGMDPTSIPLDDEKTMSIFTSCDAVGIKKGEMPSDIASIGIPEFGTNFVRQMLADTMPTTMEELVRISGLSHGTDVWMGNTRDLILQGKATLSQAICTRDDIMNYLIYCGVDKKLSFNIMERVRKGKGLNKDLEKAMLEAHVPQWYIDSCNKIKYMFPRAHAVAYVVMSYRIAYCKVYYPTAFYAATFTVKTGDFDIGMCQGGPKAVAARMAAIEKKGKEQTKVETDLLPVLELVLEMNLRGINFADVDIMNSHSKKFIILDDRTILPPLISIAGLGIAAADSIVNARGGRKFSSCEDLMQRAKIGKSHIEKLQNANAIRNLPATEQMTFFGIMGEMQ